jgi:protein-S-isoprenylcysteine O-methyltransferase Ste14
MDKFFSFLNKVFLIVALIAVIVAVLDKIFGFAVIGLYPLSYLRFTGTCLLFVVAISLYLMAGAKAPKKAAAKKRKR